MKTLVLFLLLGLVGCATNQTTGTVQNKCPALDAEKVFDPLTEKEAARVGKQLAEKDFESGCHRVLISGSLSGLYKPEIRLSKRYGVIFERVAGCVLTPGLAEGTDAYNERMRELLNGKYGKDIFKECGV